MSAYSYARSVYPEMYGRAAQTLTQTKAKISFSELVRPDSYWPQPYSIEQAFQLYRWMIKTAKPFTASHQYGVYDLFFGRGTLGTTDFSGSPIRSLDTLRRHLSYAILGRSNGQMSSDWRTKERIAFGQQRIVTFPHYAPFVGTPVLGKSLSEAQIQKLLGLYFEASGNLCVQLNSCHADAVEIIGLSVRVCTYSFKFVFDLHYGYDGSGWHHTLAEGEKFIDTFDMALAEFERVSGKQLINSLIAEVFH